MNKKMTLLGAAMMCAYVCTACDVCGCSAGGQYFGLLPNAGKNFVGVQYQYMGITTAYPSLFNTATVDRSAERYNTVQAWGRYAPGKNVMLFAFVPFRYNVQVKDTSQNISSGVGDVMVIADVVLMNKQSRNCTQQLFAGGGVKAPSGEHVGITELDKMGLPNMQPGTGSWDFLVNANYTLKGHHYGLNADVSYSLTTANADKLKYGNKLAGGLVVYRTLDRGAIAIVPQLGARYEYALHDYDNYPRRWLNEQSGGYMAFGTAAIQAYYRRIGWRVVYNIPVAQQYSSGYVIARARFETGFFILI